ncbi:Hypothetical predicted protein [Olea europaea subsp. europaea]|uniref:Uncharacterized protein n=1 Tax=Olea europaea subsp. europaea TaxID=158383 RepID=A0A8S0R8G5_OLEEU|nr:Hypothetical predicted protein [Olea europaea subsp. europaea]
MVRYQRSGLRSRPKLATRLTRELSAVTANVRTISQQNAAMRKLLKCMHGQLTNSSQNEEVVPLQREASMFDKLGPTRNRLGLTPFRPRSQAPSYFLEQATSIQLPFRGKSAWTTSTGNRR